HQDQQQRPGDGGNQRNQHQAILGHDQRFSRYVSQLKYPIMADATSSRISSVILYPANGMLSDKSRIDSTATRPAIPIDPKIILLIIRAISVATSFSEMVQPRSIAVSSGIPDRRASHPSIGRPPDR